MDIEDAADIVRPPDLERSPALDRPLRSRERAALEIAIIELMSWRIAFERSAAHKSAAEMQRSLDRIRALVPEAFV